MPINIFGAGAVQTAYVGYIDYNLTANLELVWPNAGQSSATTTAAYMNFTNAPSTAFTVTLPDATQVSVGQNFIIQNTGSSNFTLLDNDGNNIGAIVPNFIYYYILSDNSTEGGTWIRTTFGAGTSSASAAALAGLGLTAISTTLNTNVPVFTTVGPNFNVTTAHRAALIVWTSGTGTLTLPLIGAVPAGFFFSFNNEGGGVIEASSSGSLIDKVSTILVNQGQSLTFISDGTQWWTLGFGQQTFFAVDVNDKNVAGNTNRTLTTTEANKNIQQYTGALTGNITVFFPVVTDQWVVYNNTSGNFTLSVQLVGPLGTAYVIPQGGRQTFYSDGLSLYDVPNYVDANLVSFPSGSVSDPGIAFTANPATGVYYTANTVNLTSNGTRSSSFSTTAHTLGNGFTLIIPDATGAVNLRSSCTATTATISFNGISSIEVDNTGVVLFPQEAQTLAALMPASVNGALAYFNGTAWVTLAPGAEGSTLKISGGIPAWV